MIALACDHGGFALKQELISWLKEKNIEFTDYGCYEEKSCDYPVYARKVTGAITRGKAEKASSSAAPALASPSLRTRCPASGLPSAPTASVPRLPDCITMQTCCAWAGASSVRDSR